MKNHFKKCRICGLELDMESFPFRNKQLGSRRTECIKCTAVLKRKRYFENIEENKKKQKIRRDNSKDYRRAYDKKREIEQKDALKHKRKERYERNKQAVLSRRKDYYSRNRDKQIESVSKYIQENKNRVRQRQRENHKRRMSDPEYAIKKALRSRVSAAVKRKGMKCDRTIKLVGCSMKQLVSYLESKFVDGMSWDNYGPKGWHIDHIKPCDSFDLSNPEEQKICFHFTNLQPLWWLDNLKKRNKLVL